MKSLNTFMQFEYRLENVNQSLNGYASSPLKAGIYSVF